jgi:glutamate N-acetyltransferase/amino-acid N-acetyltransferase
MTRVPQGFQVSGVACGIKGDASRLDLALIVSDRPATAAGVYTQNRVYAAPVDWDRRHTPTHALRAVAINSGNANACTGPRGLADAAEMARLAAATCGAQPEQALVLSTGIIGVFLPLEKVAAGIAAAAATLGNGPDDLRRAATGMLTTDTCEKIAGRTLRLGSRQVQVTGLAKGAAMIGPNLATMLAVVLTDAPLLPEAAQELLSAAADLTFNCISVEGHTSTNDSLLLVANGAAGGPPLSGSDAEAFRAAVEEVCTELARAIPADGEGATHLITIDVVGCQTRDEARRVARAVADSPLVKTAIHGADPNWGRIVSAAGYAGVEFDPATVSLSVNGTPLYRDGAPLPFDAAAVSESIRGERDTSIVLRLGPGPGQIRFWTTDLTAEYVRLNADYPT